MKKASETIAGVVLILFAFAAVIGTTVLVHPEAFADTPQQGEILYFQGNNAGQSVVVYTTDWQQLVVDVWDGEGVVIQSEVFPSYIDDDTISVGIDVCGYNVYVIEKQLTVFNYKRFELDGVHFSCGDQPYKIWIPTIVE